MPSANAEQSARTAWVLESPEVLYAVEVRSSGIFVDCYRPGAPEGLDPPSGGAAADAPLVAVGAERRPVDWSVAGSEQTTARQLRLALSATDDPLVAEVHLAIDPSTGILTRRTTVRHGGSGPPVDITGTLGFWYRIHEPLDAMRHLAGAWARETQVQRESPNEPLRLESRAGKTGFGFQPYVALRAGSTSYLCQVWWSGNWAIDVVPDAEGATLYGGLNNWRFRHRLRSGKSLRLPTVLFGRFSGGLNAATQRLHDYRRRHRPDPDRPIPVQFNSWYPYLGEPTAREMLALIPFAQRIGCEAFVVDAGWYAADDDDSDAEWTERTGDWRPSLRRFPNGLREISASCREHGLRFGLWFEPEVIGQLSSIRREHPEWLHATDGRPPRAEDRAVLNLGIPEARQHVTERITRILASADVGWMKWDFNADLGAGGWAPGLPDSLTDQDPLIAHYEGLYALQDAIRARFPDLILEMCASGGGRMDGELLSRAHVNWISDWPGPLRKLAIHVGSQLAHPAVVCNDWLIEWPPHSIAGYDDNGNSKTDERGDMPFRLRVAMLGSFGISARIDRWSDVDFRTASRHISLYREKLRSIIHYGDQYLLTPAPSADGEGDWAAIWYAAKDGLSGVLFAFRLNSADASRAFGLPGLIRDRRYRTRTFPGDGTESAGEALMSGLTITIPDRYESELCLVEVD